MNDSRLTGFEGLSLMSLSFLFYVCDETLPELNVRTGGAGWLSQIIGFALIFIVFMIYSSLMRRFEGRNFMQISEEVYGRPVSKLILALLFAFFFAIISLLMCKLIFLLNMYSYTMLNPLYMLGVFIAVASVAAYYPFKGFARVASICMPLSFAALLIILLIASNQYSVDSLLPVLGYGALPAAEAGLGLFSSCNLFIAFILYSNFFDGSKGFRKTGAAAIGLCALVFVLATLCYSMAVPYHKTQIGLSGLLQLAQNTYISRFFQRFESVFFIFFCMGVIMIFTLGMFSLKTLYARIFSIEEERQAKMVIIPVAILLTCTAELLLYFPEYARLLKNFLDRTSFIFIFGLVLLTLIIASLKKQKPEKIVRCTSMLLLPVIAAGFLSGCQPYHEPDEEVNGLVLGYDKGEVERYKITVKFMHEGSKSEGGSPEKPEESSPPEDVFTVDAPSSIAMIDMLNAVIPKHISLLHTKMLVISEELAREGVDDIISAIVNYNETKSNMAVVICDGKAQEYISAENMKIYVSLPMKTEMLMQHERETSAYDVVSISDFYNDYRSEYGGALTLYSGVKPKKNQDKQEDGQEDKQGQSGSPQENEINPAKKTFLDGFYPGELPIDGKYDIENAGMAVFSDAVMVGALNTRETASYSICKGDIMGASYVVRDLYDDDYNIAFTMSTRGPAKIKTRIDNNGTAHIEIRPSLKLEMAMVQNTAADYEDAATREKLREYTKKQIDDDLTRLIEKSQNELDVDILQLGKRLSGKFLTVQDWRAYSWPERYKDAVITVDCDLML